MVAETKETKRKEKANKINGVRKNELLQFLRKIMLENTGVIIKQQESDYIAGAIPYEEVCDDWTIYLPKGERQHSVYMDSMACVSYSALNIIEIQLNYMVANSFISEEAVKFFTDEGYLLNGQFNFSDRFTAKMSGTTKDGNSLQKVWDSIKHDGLLPEKDWNYPRDQRTPIFDWNDYYKEIPQELKDRAKKVLNYLSFAYEWTFQNKISVYTENELKELKRELKHAPLQLAAPTCNWNQKYIKPCGKIRASHATTIYDIDSPYIHDYDHYIPFLKLLSLDYIMPWIMKGVVILKANNNDMKKLYLDTKTKRQYVEGDDKVKRWLFNPIVLEAFDSMGIVNKENPIKVDGISGIIGKPIAVIDDIVKNV